MWLAMHTDRDCEVLQVGFLKRDTVDDWMVGCV